MQGAKHLTPNKKHTRKERKITKSKPTKWKGNSQIEKTNQSYQVEHKFLITLSNKKNQGWLRNEYEEGKKN